METRQLGAEATEKCGCFLSQLNLQLPPLLRYSVFNLLVSQFALLHPSKNGTRSFFGIVRRGHCAEKAFLVYFSRRLRFCVCGYTWLRAAVCVISLWLRSQLPHTFPGFWGGPQMHFKSPRGHLTGGPAPPTPPG